MHAVMTKLSNFRLQRTRNSGCASAAAEAFGVCGEMVEPIADEGVV